MTTAAYSTVYRELLRLVGKALLHPRVCRAMARKAGITVGTVVQTDDVGGVFALLGSATEPYPFAFDSGTTPFPAAGEMTRNADDSFASEERLIVNVATAGPSGATLNAGDASAPIDATGLQISAWGPASATPISWAVDSPSGGAIEVGLIQRQTR